jgi:endogenous inhibitor of DNA gyrase (YacG/DUF329 family)
MLPVVKCPTCGRPVEWSEAAKHRPFCSARCKTLDLGAWASDRYVVPGDSAAEADETPPSETAASNH